MTNMHDGIGLIPGMHGWFNTNSVSSFNKSENRDYRSILEMLAKNLQISTFTAGFKSRKKNS